MSESEREPIVIDEVVTLDTDGTDAKVRKVSGEQHMKRLEVFSC